MIGDVDRAAGRAFRTGMSPSSRIASDRWPTSPTPSRSPPTRGAALCRRQGARDQRAVSNRAPDAPEPAGGDRRRPRARRGADLSHAPHARQLPRRPRGRAAARHLAGVRRLDRPGRLSHGGPLRATRAPIRQAVCSGAKGTRRWSAGPSAGRFERSAGSSRRAAAQAHKSL